MVTRVVVRAEKMVGKVMDMTYLSGRSFSSITTGYRNSGGDWDVVVTMSETLTYPNGTVREETIENKGSHADFNTAHKAAMRNVLQELQDLVYSRGFDSLIEARDYQRNLEEGDDGIKADEIAPPE